MPFSLMTEGPDAVGSKAGGLSDPEADSLDGAKCDQGFRECRLQARGRSGPVDPGQFDGCWIVIDIRWAQGVFGSCGTYQ